MGYYTNYTMSIYKNEENVTAYDIINKMQEFINERNNAFYPFEREVADLYNDEDNKMFYDVDFEADECKWYDHDDDMARLSKCFPSVIFQLDGEGEENGDMWTAWYKNGRVITHKAKIIIDPLDEKEFS